ncbi:MAG: toxoflavin biosynthesis protein ToxD [Pseudonocardiales bacterium]|jgi:formylglycine-generating enzyme required for sulfatase activity|nr:toxoflavin biosynthesis protein ToxD [Pseudonocardiales bacterium]
MNGAPALPTDRPLHDVDDRTLVGLGRRYEERLPAYLLASHRALLATAPAELVVLLDDVSVATSRRIAAGRILSLVGDPRIATMAPRMRPVPGGEATIGTDANDVERVLAEYAGRGVRAEWIAKEIPRHAVSLAAFAIMRYPVTNAEYRRYLLATDETELPTSWHLGVADFARANEPVWTVSPHAAQRYAAWLSAQTGRGFRLPREAEWEFAAAGPDRCEYPWGDQWRPEHANTAEDGPLTSTPVGCYLAGRSHWGADDMAGNVEEWVADTYRPYPGATPIFDDLWRHDAHYRICRGGSFARFGDLARCARRHGQYPREIYAVGFRLVEDVASGGLDVGARQPQSRGR